MAEYHTVTPVLSSKQGYLVDVRDQVSTLIRNIIANPGWTSSLWEDRLVSFQKLAAAFEGDRGLLCGELKKRVSAILSASFPDYTFTTDFTSEDYHPDDEVESDQPSVRYTVKLKILMQRSSAEDNGITSALISGKITIDKETGGIELLYDANQDTIEL